MKFIKGIMTTLRLLIQPFGRAIDRFMVCFFPDSRTYLVYTINRCTWLSNILRWCTRKPLFYEKTRLLQKKIILHIGKFVISHQKLRKICKYILSHFPSLQKKLQQQIYIQHSSLNIKSILNRVELSPKSAYIYKLLLK